MSIGGTKGRKTGQRIGPLDLVKFYQVCYLRGRGLSEKDIGEKLGISRQAVNYQLNLHDPIEENRTVNFLLALAEEHPKDAEMLKAAAKQILEMQLQIRQHAITKLDEAA